MKISSLEKVTKTLSKTRKGKKVVFFSGAFDLFHYGHFRALNRTSKLGDILVVQIDGNRLVKNRKGEERPFIDEKERTQIIASLKFVNFAFISNIPSEDVKTLQMVNPDVFVRARLPHETNKDRKIREKTILKKIPSSKIVWLKQTPEISTTILLNGELKNSPKLHHTDKNVKKEKVIVPNAGGKKNHFTRRDHWNIQQD